MVKRKGIMFGAACAALAVGCGVLASLGDKDYNAEYNPEQLKLDYALLNGTSAYIQQYQEKTPKDAFEYIQKTLSVVKKNKAFMEKAGKLESEVQRASSEIGNLENPEVYRPVLKNINGKIKKMYNNNPAKESVFSLAGTVIIGFISASLSLYGFSKRKE